MEVVQAVVQSVDGFYCLYCHEVWVKLVYQLTANAQKLAVYSLSLNSAETALEEDQIQFEDLGENLGCLFGGVEFEEMKEGQVGVESSVVVNIDLGEGIRVYTCIFHHFPVVLTGDVVEDVLAALLGDEDGGVYGEHIPEVFLVDHQEGLDLSPRVEIQFAVSSYSYFLQHCDFRTGYDKSMDPSV